MRQSGVKTMIALIVLLMILGAGIGVVAYFTNGFDFSETQSPADPDDKPQGSGELLLTMNGEQLSVDSELPKEVELRIDVNAEEFTVEILPNGNASFDFRHNGTLVKFPYIEGNFNEAFGVEICDGYFTMNAALSSMEMILEGFYPGEEISDITALDYAADYFVLRVSGNGKTFELPLSGFYEILHIMLDKTEIVF